MESQATPSNRSRAFKAVIAAAFVGAAWLASHQAQARPADTEIGAPVPCAVIDQAEGQVDVLDEDRAQTLSSTPSSGVPCGGWVSVGQGSADLRQRDGFVFHGGIGSFIQFLEPSPDGRGQGDHAILFGGEVFVQAGGGAGELRIMTANARVRIKRGSAIVAYSHDDEQTLLYALDGSATLENRFEPSRTVVTVKAGEMTTLDFKLLRVVPDTPSAVSVAALRTKFAELRVPERDRGLALAAARQRHERLFANMADVADRAPASAKTGKKARRGSAPGKDVRARLTHVRLTNPPLASYSSRVDDARSRTDRKQWISSMAAGDPDADALVSPKKLRARRGGIEVLDPEASKAHARRSPASSKAHELTQDDQEKLKLIDELSHIREDE